MRLINYKWGSHHLQLYKEEEEAGKLFGSQDKYYLQCNVSVKVTVIIKCIRADIASTAWDVWLDFTGFC